MLEDLSTRSRIFLLVIASALPIIALSVYVAFEQRVAAEERAREEIQQHAELVAVLFRELRPESLTWRGPAVLGRGQMVTILDQNGSVIAQHPPLFARLGEPFPNRPVLEGIVNGNEVIFDHPDPAGVRRLYAVKRVGATLEGAAPISIVVSVPKAVIHQDIDRALALTLSGIAAVTLLLILSAWYGAERLVLRRVGVLLDMTQRVRGGDLAARTGVKPTREELSQLGGALDEMAEQLQTREAKLRHLMEELREQAATDALTGLYNRRYFWDLLEREVLATERNRRPFSVIMLDIDHFKEINDTWGHDAGDYVLKEIANMLRASVRGSDVAVRYGGEEFAMLLPEASAGAAAERAESLRRALEALVIRYGEKNLSVTASFGVVEYDGSTHDAAALVKAVDEALYAAKAGGRNRVVWAAPRERATDQVTRSVAPAHLEVT